MYQTTPLTVIYGDIQNAIAGITHDLTLAGLQVIQSFDLQVARAAHTHCTCPHHGTDQCDCQMVILMVYDKDTQPISLVLHGHDGETHLAFVDHPAQQADKNIVAAVMQILRSSYGADGNTRLKPYAA